MFYVYALITFLIYFYKKNLLERQGGHPQLLATLQRPAMVRAGVTEASSQELHPGLPCRSKSSGPSLAIPAAVAAAVLIQDSPGVASVCLLQLLPEGAPL